MKKNRSRSGQAIVEYLLLLGIIVGIVGGIVRIAAYRWFNTQVTAMREPLEKRLSQADGYLGIPIGWFFAGRDMNEVNLAFQRNDDNRRSDPSTRDDTDPNDPNANGADKNGGGSGDPDSGGADPGGDSDGPNGPGGPGGRGSANPPKVQEAPRSTPPAGTRPNAGDSKAGDDEESKRSSDSKKKPSELKAGEFSGSVDSDLQDENGDGKIDEKDEEIKRQNDEAGLTPEMKARRRMLEETQRRGSGGCRKLSTFELIRIAIFIMLAFIAFIIFFASRGKGGDQ